MAGQGAAVRDLSAAAGAHWLAGAGGSLAPIRSSSSPVPPAPGRWRGSGDAIRPLKYFSGWSLPMRFAAGAGIARFMPACTCCVICGSTNFSIGHGDFSDLLARPFISIGTLAFALLLPLAITSTDGWIRRLKRATGPDCTGWCIRRAGVAAALFS